ncbi:MAG: hypothetical protein A2V88_08960 [Elusimicrobia bacterium RBG_16_66_12]|nr:MAG: hypothetical protein A2V88_08960 [Elusimicrobia bacterium RBG_16_66_12]
MNGATTYLLTLQWGIGDVLLSTATVRALKQSEPDCAIFYQTLVKGKHRLQYDPPGGEPGSGGAPDECLWHNPNIARIIDISEPASPMMLRRNLLYVRVGDKPLDRPIQAKMFDILGLPWNKHTRFDMDYYLQPHEAEDAAQIVPPGPLYCAVSPRCGGWPGKQWNDEGWAGIIASLLCEDWVPVILGGDRLQGQPWAQGINLSGALDIRASAAVLDRCQAMITLESTMSNLRFALRKPAVVVTCATSFGLKQIVWAPPELLTEVRNREWCEPCMWRGLHVAGKPRVPPGNIKDCPAGKSLRDVPPEEVWPVLLRHLEATR